VNSSVPETAIFILHKVSKIKCCLFLQESLAVAKRRRATAYMGQNLIKKKEEKKPQQNRSPSENYRFQAD